MTGEQTKKRIHELFPQLLDLLKRGQFTRADVEMMLKMFDTARAATQKLLDRIDKAGG